MKTELSKEEFKALIKECITEVLEDREPEWVKIDAAAKLLGLTRTSLYGLVKRGKIPHAKIGGRLHFSRFDIDKWIRSGEIYQDWPWKQTTNLSEVKENANKPKKRKKLIG